MSKPSTEKQDQLRAMREANYAASRPKPVKLADLRKAVAAIPAKKPPKAKR